MGLDKIVVVKKSTPLEELLRRYATLSQVKFFLESRGESYALYKDAHRAYTAGLKRVLEVLPSGMRVQIIDKEQSASFQFGEKDIVVAVGDDGLVVNVAKYVGLQPVISVNPDTKRFDGVLSCCDSETFSGVLARTLEGKFQVQELTMAEARLDDGQVLYALNDFFVGKSSHVSARYTIEYGRVAEMQSSSGIIISTGTGSTGWLTSVILGAYAIAGVRFDLDTLRRQITFGKDADYLLFHVREPFPSKSTGVGIVQGEVTRESPLRVVSQMPENGVIFGDGVEADYLDFSSGKRVVIQPSSKKVLLVCAGVV